MGKDFILLEETILRASNILSVQFSFGEQTILNKLVGTFEFKFKNSDSDYSYNFVVESFNEALSNFLTFYLFLPDEYFIYEDMIISRENISRVKVVNDITLKTFIKIDYNNEMYPSIKLPIINPMMDYLDVDLSTVKTIKLWEILNLINKKEIQTKFNFKGRTIEK